MIGDARTGSGFGGLARYLHSGDRVAWAEARNLPTTEPDLVPAMMRSTAQLSRRVKDPVLHYSISWPEYEQLPKEKMLYVADQTLADLGLDEHQAVVVAHNDTDHPHVHVMVNRVHPQTGRAWEKWKYKTRLEKSLKSLEKEMGLTEVPGRLSGPENERTVRRLPSKGEQKFAEHLDVAALDHWHQDDIDVLKDQLAPHFAEARDWSDLDERIKTEGVTLYAKGRGLIVTNGERYAKLSEMGKGIRKNGLEDQFGETFGEYAEQRAASREQQTDYWGMLRGLGSQLARAGKNLREWVFGRESSLLNRLRQPRSRPARGLPRRRERDGPER